MCFGVDLANCRCVRPFYQPAKHTCIADKEFIILLKEYHEMKLNKYIDHTNLKPFATKADIEKLCTEAKEYDFASVCVHPCYVELCSERLVGTGVMVCTVIGFPLGANTTETKIVEAKSALASGCNEFDMVINVGALKDSRDEYVKNEVEEIVKAVKGNCVKVIIETGLLTDEEKARATRLACEAGAAYVKTCTGFSDGIATVADIELMKANLSGGAKLKASAGIRTYEQALALINAGADRIGTSAGKAILEGAKAK